ncbi:MAG TPA: hypothetical protein VFW65_22150 [Pseudonocardiaceae bacterium]|nr:hypothetical protein [Pseudonocardiaceae bacterium]
MSHDTCGYRERWTVPCADLFGQPKRVVLALADDRRTVLLITPADTVRLTTDSARELAQDLRDTANRTE